MRTHKGLLEWPIAVFPNADEASLMCLYELDTTIAVFIIDLTKRNNDGVTPPPRLRDTVSFSNFEVRACTKAEVAYAREYISTNADMLRKRIFALHAAREPEQLKKNLLYALALGTTPNEERDVTLRGYSQPQILPEN